MNQRARRAFRFVLLRGKLAGCLGKAGEVEGLDTVEQAIARSDKTEERWTLAELLRVKGELPPLRARRGTQRQPRITSGKRSIGRAGMARAPGS